MACGLMAITEQQLQLSTCILTMRQVTNIRARLLAKYVHFDNETGHKYTCTSVSSVRAF
jgi:hypothetical protein